MSANERDFSNFYLGDNVYELADGLIPEVARRLDVLVGQEPNRADLQVVMEKAGKNKVLRHNQEIDAISRADMANLVETSSIQQALSRSLWTPGVAASSSNIDAVVIAGGVANWQDRTAALIDRSLVGTPVYSLGGNRPMDTGTEVTNPNIKRLFKDFGHYPKESEYAASVITPRLKRMGHSVLASSFDTGSGDELLAKLFEENPQLLDKRIAFVRVANAGVIMAIQMRDAARKLNPDFDSDSSSPQAFTITDSFPLARTDRQVANPAKYQKPDTALRQLVLTAKKLHEATGGE